MWEIEKAFRVSETKQQKASANSFTSGSSLFSMLMRRRRRRKLLGSHIFATDGDLSLYPDQKELGRFHQGNIENNLNIFA